MEVIEIMIQKIFIYLQNILLFIGPVHNFLIFNPQKTIKSNLKFFHH